MGKVYLVDLPRDVGKRGLIGDGKLLKFKFNGDCLGEFPLDYTVTGMQEVDIVSVLVTHTEVELGFNINQDFSREITSKELPEIARILYNATGLIFIGRRESSVENVSFSQYIYVFLKGTINKDVFKR